MLSKTSKFSNRKQFVLDDVYTVECTVFESRYSWGHYAVLYKNGTAIEDEKYTYYNRTWESYTYQSVIHGILSRAKLPAKYRTLADEIGSGNVKQELKSLGAVVALAGLIQTDPAKANEAQVKALEIATGGAVQRPADWDTLSEEEKQVRLNKAVSVLK